MKYEEELECLFCTKYADWIRHTQFSGDHPFCDEHAKKENGFLENDNYQSWEKLID